MFHYTIAHNAGKHNPFTLPDTGRIPLGKGSRLASLGCQCPLVLGPPLYDALLSEARNFENHVRLGGKGARGLFYPNERGGVGGSAHPSFT